MYLEEMYALQIVVVQLKSVLKSVRAKQNSSEQEG